MPGGKPPAGSTWKSPATIGHPNAAGPEGTAMSAMSRTHAAPRIDLTNTSFVCIHRSLVNGSGYCSSIRPSIPEWNVQTNSTG